MALGQARGIVGLGATGTYEYREAPPINIPSNESGGYSLSYQFLVYFAGEAAYMALVNGVDVWPGAGWRLDSVEWVLLEEEQTYDCLNGNCVLSTKHSTDGIYQSLAECEANCGSVCDGECISKDKLSQLTNATIRLKRKNCGC